MSGLRVGRLGLGTMTWGGTTDADDAADQLSAFRDAGGTLVDTADHYGGGRSEELLGTLLGGGVGRDGIVLATKAGLPTALGSGSSRRHLLAALDASLDRLRTDHVDLWQVHRFDPTVPFGETLSALDAAITSGRARYVGVSNYTGWQLAQSATWQAAGAGRTPLVSTQMEWSLLERGVEREVAPYCVSAGVGLLPWSPLGRGVLTGKYRGGIPVDSRGAGDRATDPQESRRGGAGGRAANGGRAAAGGLAAFVAPYLDEASAHIVDAVVTAADGLGVSPAAVALAWVRDRPGVAAPIVGARTAAQLLAALESESLELPAEITSALDDVSAPPTGYPERSGTSPPPAPTGSSAPQPERPARE